MGESLASESIGCGGRYLSGTSVLKEKMIFNVFQDLIRLGGGAHGDFVHNPLGIAYDYCAEFVGIIPL